MDLIKLVGQGPESNPDPDLLKGRSADALERAFAFVNACGDETWQLLARVVLRASPESEAVGWIESRQQPSGGFETLGLAEAGAPGLTGLAELESSELRGTLEALCLLGDLSTLHRRSVQRAAEYLESNQLEDGSWGPPALPAGDRLFLTGMLGGLLGRTHFARPQLLESAGAFLQSQWSPKELVHGRWEALAALALFFTSVQGDESEGVLSWCGRELERSFRERRFRSLATVRVLMYCNAAALPGAELEPSDLIQGLLAEQAGSGGFASGLTSDDTAQLAPTVDAMRALILLCSAL